MQRLMDSVGFGSQSGSGVDNSDGQNLSTGSSKLDQSDTTSRGSLCRRGHDAIEMPPRGAVLVTQLGTADPAHECLIIRTKSRKTGVPTQF